MSSEGSTSDAAGTNKGQNATRPLLARFKEVTYIAAAVSVGIYFIYQAWGGYFNVNMSLDVRAERQATAVSGEDWLVVRVNLARGNNGTLALHAVQLKLAWQGILSML